MTIYRDYTAWITEEHIRNWRKCSCKRCQDYADLLKRDKSEQERTGSMVVQVPSSEA